MISCNSINYNVKLQSIYLPINNSAIGNKGILNYNEKIMLQMFKYTIATQICIDKGVYITLTKL